MKRKCGHMMQAAGAIVLFAAAGASDSGVISVGGLVYALGCAALVFAAGFCIARTGAAAPR